MKKLKPTLVAVVLLFASLPATTAQDAPAPQGAQADSPALLTPDEVKLWQAWMHGDLRECYSQAQAMLEAPRPGMAFRAVVALQARCADELGWHEAHANDLRSLIDSGPHRDFLRWHLMQRLKHLGETDEIQQVRDKLGMLTKWWVAGPFNNDRGQGFEDTLEPEINLDPNAEYSGKDGQAVTFRELPAEPLDGTIDLGAMMRPNQEAVAYLLTAVYAEREGYVKLQTGSTSSLKAWRLNTLYTDEKGDAVEPEGPPHGLIFNVDREREMGFQQEDSYNSLNLRKGWNVLLVKSGNSDTAWKLNVRLDAHGREWRQADSLAELEQALAADTTHIYSRAIGLSPIPDPRRNSFVSAVSELLVPYRDKTSGFARRTLDDLLTWYDEQEKEPEGVRASERAALAYLAAWASRSAATFASGREENRRRELLEQCVELDPQAARALLELSQYYTTTSSNPTLAHDYARKAVETNPGWVEARLYAARVVLMKGLDVEVERELAKLLQEFPAHVGVLRFAAYYAGLRRDYRLSNELFEKALNADFADGYARDRLAERAVAKNDLAAARRLVKQARRLDPFDIDGALKMAELHLNTGRYALAENELAGALKVAPRDDELLFMRGQVYTAWADNSEGDEAERLREKALDAYADALDANPRRDDIERYLEFLEGEQPPFEAALQEDITARIEAVLDTPVDGDNPYEVVYRDEIVLVNDDGTTSQYIQKAYRVTNDDGRGWLQRVSVPAYSDQAGRCVEARVFRGDGYIEEGRRSRFSASFPPLEIGDVVQVRFRVTDQEQSFFGDFYGTRKVLHDFVPVREVRYAWVLPPGREFHTYRTGDAPGIEKTEVNGRRVWSVRAGPLPKLHDEPLAPPSHQRGDTVQISTYENWKDFGRWYYNLIRKQLEPTPEMIAEVNRITDGLKTEKEKATAVYNWVVTQVRYNADWHFGVHGYKPFSAGAVFARCIGDCKDKAILICTMLRLAGVDAYPVIINLSAFRGDEDITLPMPAHFNHAIAYIEYSDGTGQFVDGTATYNGIDELPGADRGANVIVVRPDGGERVRIPPGEPGDDTQTDEIDIEFAGGGTLKLKVKRTASGDTASILRARYETPGDRKKRLEHEWSDYYPGAKVTDVKVGDLSDLDADPVIEFRVELPNAFKRKDGGIEFRAAPDPREWTQTEFAGLTNRRTALLMPAPFERISITRFKLPEGYRVVKQPDGLGIDHPNAELEVSTASRDGTLTVRRRYTLKGEPLPPDEYPGFRRALIRFDEAEGATIRLEKK